MDSDGFAKSPLFETFSADQHLCGYPERIERIPNMPLPSDEKLIQLGNDLIPQFDTIFGLHPGFRPAHAKGVLLTGTFNPSAGGRVTHASAAHHARFDSGNRAVLQLDRSSSRFPITIRKRILTDLPSVSIWPITSTPTSSAIRRMAFLPEPARSSLSFCALRPRAIRRRHRHLRLRSSSARIRPRSPMCKRPSQVLPVSPGTRISA